MSQNIWGGGGAIFARERSDRAGGGCGRGVSPSHGEGAFFAIWGIPKKEISTWHVLYHAITCMELKISHGLILFWGGGGASAPKPPPHQYASGDYVSKDTWSLM